MSEGVLDDGGRAARRPLRDVATRDGIAEAAKGGGGSPTRPQTNPRRLEPRWSRGKEEAAAGSAEKCESGSRIIGVKAVRVTAVNHKSQPSRGGAAHKVTVVPERQPVQHR